MLFKKIKICDFQINFKNANEHCSRKRKQLSPFCCCVCLIFSRECCYNDCLALTTTSEFSSKFFLQKKTKKNTHIFVQISLMETHFSMSVSEFKIFHKEIRKIRNESKLKKHMFSIRPNERSGHNSNSAKNLLRHKNDF